MSATSPASRYAVSIGASPTHRMHLQPPDTGSARGAIVAPSPHSTTSTISTDSGGSSARLTARALDIVAEDIDAEDVTPTDADLGVDSSGRKIAPLAVRDLAIHETAAKVTPRTPIGLGKFSARHIVQLPREQVPATTSASAALSGPSASSSMAPVVAAVHDLATTTTTGGGTPSGATCPRRFSVRRIAVRPQGAASAAAVTVVAPITAASNITACDVVKAVVAAIFAVVPACVEKCFDWPGHVVAVVTGTILTIPGTIIGIFAGVLTLISGDGYFKGVKEGAKMGCMMGSLVGGAFFWMAAEMIYKVANEIFHLLHFSKLTNETFESYFTPMLYPNFLRLIKLLYDNEARQVVPAPRR